MSNPTHRKTAARALAEATGLTYQQALNLIINNTIPQPEPTTATEEELLTRGITHIHEALDEIGDHDTTHPETRERLHTLIRQVLLHHIHTLGPDNPHTPTPTYLEATYLATSDHLNHAWAARILDTDEYLTITTRHPRLHRGHSPVWTEKEPPSIPSQDPNPSTNIHKPVTQISHHHRQGREPTSHRTPK